MELRLYDITMPSINPTSQLGTLSAQPPTGGGSVLVGSATTPGLSVPTIEPIYRVVADIGYTVNSVLVPAPAATLSVQQFIASNTGGAQFAISATGTLQPFPRFSYGIVVSPPIQVGGPNGTLIQNVPGGQSLICVEGMAVATVQATVAAGAYLGTSTVRGQLVTTAVTAPGVCLGIAMAGITGAGSQGIIKVGGF